MSPEQASGRPVDKRTDTWAFGALLFEALTGRRPFAGENVSEVLASVLKEEPPWERLPEGTPRSLDRLLRRCLRKKPRERLHDIGDARLEIEEARRELASGPTEGRTAQATKGAGRARLVLTLAAALAIAAFGLGAGWLLARPPARGPWQLSMPLAPAELDGAFALSRDGSRLAFPGRDEKGGSVLFVRALSEPAARGLAGTEGALSPFFSPDGEWIAFFDGISKLRRVPANGGPVVTVAEDNLRDSSGTWTADGWIVFDRQQDVWVLDLQRGALVRISSAPGEDETGAWSPDGQRIAWTGSRPGEKRALFRRRSDGSGPEERLWSDERHFHVGSWTAAGIVVTVSGPKTGWDVLLVDPDKGDARPVLEGRFNEMSARVSPDGRLLAFVSDETGRNEIYVQSFPEPGGKVQVSLDGGVQPEWRPGTREIVYRGGKKIMSVTQGPGDVPAVAAPRPLFDDRLEGRDTDHTAFAVFRDGSLLAIAVPERPPVQDLRIVLDWTRSLGLGR
jgi:Tol biopolymer transport system component